MWTLFVVVLLLQFIKRLWFPFSTSLVLLVLFAVNIRRVPNFTEFLRAPSIPVTPVPVTPVPVTPVPVTPVPVTPVPVTPVPIMPSYGEESA